MFNQQQQLSGLRGLLTGIGPLAVALGIVSAADLGPLIEAILAVIGGGSFIGGMVWGWYSNRHQNIMDKAANVIKTDGTATMAGPVVEALRDAGAQVNTSMMPNT